MRYLNEDELRNTNTTAYCIRTYANEKQIREVLDDERLNWWRAIVHDKDVDETGNPKVTHTHIVCEFGGRIKASTVKNLFKGLKDEKGEHINTEVQVCRHKAGAYAYLTHDTAKARQQGKHAYDEEDIFGEGEVELKQEQNSQFICMLNDIRKECSPYELVLKYGMLYISQKRNLESIAKDQERWERNKEIEAKLKEISESGEIPEGMPEGWTVEQIAMLLKQVR